VLETRKVDNVNSIELTMVSDKLAAVADYPIGEPLTVPDEQIIETRHVTREVDNDTSTESKTVSDKASVEDNS
jgi:hypothetical protein